MPRALFSVSDKTGLVELGQTLTTLGWDIVATGRTAETLEQGGVAVTPVEQLTGTPEMLGGRVKTLHPAIHAPILARDRTKDFAELNEHGFAPIDLVVCNLYPFQQTIAQDGVTLAQAIEQIDIGGVTLIRAAAKNFERVTVVIDPYDYEMLRSALFEQGSLSLEERQRLAAKAFAHTMTYDTAIHAYLSNENILSQDTPVLPETFTLGMALVQPLRYGENPHQHAGLYAAKASIGPLGGELLHGKPLSYNNLLDADGAWRAAVAFDEPVVVIVKHVNPCGIAIGDSIAAAFPAALASDPVSAFGGVIAVNRPVDISFVQALGSLFVEVILAPSFEEEALNMLRENRKNCRLLAIPTTQPTQIDFRSIIGGVLVQQSDYGDPANQDWQIMTRRRPTPTETEALKFAWKAVQYVKSNAIVLAGATTTIGIGGGLPSRVDSVKIAIEKAGEHAKGSVLASDAFFPFADGIQVAAQAGVTAIIQPGGSIRDQEVIAAADAASIAMIFTGIRHFRH